MKVNTFISLFNARTKNIKVTPEVAQDIINDLVKPMGYMNYDDKINVAMETIKESQKTFPVTPNRGRIFVVKLLNLYTNLEVTMQDFDVLCQNLLLEPILYSFKDEYKACESVLQMCLQDKMLGDESWADYLG